MDSAPLSLATQRALQRVGRVLRDKWRIESVLGIGGFGAVYAATHRTGKRVAIKLLHPELSAIADARSRFIREAYAVNAVDHPGMVSIIDDDVDEDGCVFLVMELLEGETLEARRVRSGGSLDFDDVLSLADQVLDILAAAHDKGVVHRDLKPDNVFFLRTGQVKLLDFGVAKLREAPRGKALTAQGIVIGTPAFMPPEQARGQWDQVDERTDLWSMGATIFTLLTGQLVHGNLTPAESLIAAVTKPAPKLGEVAVGAPRALSALVDKALAFNREDRFQTAREMQAAVRELYHELTGGLASTAPHVVEPSALPSVGKRAETEEHIDEEPTAKLDPARVREIINGARLSSTTARSPVPNAKLLSPDSEPTIVGGPPSSMTKRRSASGLLPPELKGRKLASIFDSADFGDQSQWSEAIADATAALNASAEAAKGDAAARGASEKAPEHEEDATIPKIKQKTEEGDEAGKALVARSKSKQSKTKPLVFLGLSLLLLSIVAVAVYFARARGFHR